MVSKAILVKARAARQCTRRTASGGPVGRSGVAGLLILVMLNHKARWKIDYLPQLRSNTTTLPNQDAVAQAFGAKACTASSSALPYLLQLQTIQPLGKAQSHL